MFIDAVEREFDREYQVKAGLFKSKYENLTMKLNHVQGRINWVNAILKTDPI